MYRMIGAALIALAAALLIGPRLIRYLKKLHFGQTIYELGPSHQQKQGTPVMGGLMMAAGILLGSLICHPGKWDGIWDFVFPLLLVSFLSMAVGFADDYIKAVKKRHDGLSPWQKIAGQVIVSLGFSLYCYFSPRVGSAIRIPFTGAEWDLGIFYIPLMTLLVIFIVNSSNLQDGLDGLGFRAERKVELCERHGNHRRFRYEHGRSLHRIPPVQPLSGENFHGRYRKHAAGRRNGRYGHAAENAAAPAADLLYPDHEQCERDPAAVLL